MAAGISEDLGRNDINLRSNKHHITYRESTNVAPQPEKASSNCLSGSGHKISIELGMKGTRLGQSTVSLESNNTKLIGMVLIST
jgi:hypothetical protein